MILESRGISSFRRPSGYPFPSTRSWWWRPDFSNVVDETAEVDKTLLPLRKPHALRNISRVRRDGRRVTRRISVTSVERGNQSRRKRKVRAFKTLVDGTEIICQAALFLIKNEQSLGRKSRDDEQGQREWRKVSVGNR